MQASVWALSGPVPKACLEKTYFLLWRKTIWNHLQDWINLKLYAFLSRKMQLPSLSSPFFLFPFLFFFIVWCKIIWIDNCLHISSHLSSLNIILVCVHTNRKGLFYHCFACSNKKHLSGAAVCIHFWQLSQRVSQIACIACSLVMFAFSGTKSFWNLKYANDWSVFFTNTKYHRWFLLSRSIFFFFWSWCSSSTLIYLWHPLEIARWMPLREGGKIISGISVHGM